MMLNDVKAHREVIGAEIDRRLQAAVTGGRWIMGPEVAEFEGALERWVGGDVRALGCANGTDALVLALQALELAPGQAVVCPSFTFVATAEAVALLGGVPVFADVDAGTFNITADATRAAAEAAASAGLDVAGVIAVDLFGRPADYEQLRAVTEDLGIWLVADAAQSFGASLGDTRVGALADITTTSFFPAKPLGCYGDGGAVFTSDAGLTDRMESLRVHGKGTHKYENVLIGQNSRLDTLQAAILLPKLEILADEIVARQARADRYDQGLADLVETPSTDGELQSVWAQYTIRTAPGERDQLAAYLASRDIPTAIYYPKPLHRQPAYEHFDRPDSGLAVSESLAGQVLSLPMHPYLDLADCDVVISAIAAFRDGARADA